MAAPGFFQLATAFFCLPAMFAMPLNRLLQIHLGFANPLLTTIFCRGSGTPKN
jgi:hypothetical protein